MAGPAKPALYNVKKFYAFTAFFVGLAIVAGVVTVADRRAQDSKRAYPITARTELTLVSLELANAGTWRWQDVTLELQPGGYTWADRNLLIPAGAAQRVGLRLFVDSSGQRFDPISRKPQRLTISVTAPDGRRASTTEELR